MEAPLLLSLLVFLLVFEAVWLAAPAPSSELGRVAERVTTYVVPAWEPKPEETVSIYRRKRASRMAGLDAALDRFSLGGRLGTQLVRAGLTLRSGEFLVMQLATATALAVLGAIFLSGTFGTLVAATLGFALGFVLPMGWLRFRISKRLDEFEDALPDALDLIAGSLRAGFGLPHGLDLVAKGNHGACADEFGQVLHEVNLGSDLDVSLARVVQRVDSDDIRLLATAVAVQRRTGGNLVEVLAQIAGVMRERQRLRRDLKVITTAPRVSGYVVALLPVFTLAMMFLTSQYYVQTLFSSPTGRIATAVGGVLVVVGLYVNRRIATVDY
jgi:tight adherence protein B